VSSLKQKKKKKKAKTKTKKPLPDRKSICTLILDFPAFRNKFLSLINYPADNILLQHQE
jgi:hypothetical protein